MLLKWRQELQWSRVTYNQNFAEFLKGQVYSEFICRKSKVLLLSNLLLDVPSYRYFEAAVLPFIHFWSVIVNVVNLEEILKFRLEKDMIFVFNIWRWNWWTKNSLLNWCIYRILHVHVCLGLFQVHFKFIFIFTRRAEQVRYSR